METIVPTKRQSHLLKNNLLLDRQFGFRPHHSTADILTIFSQHWSNALDKGGEVCLIALDIKGAFDKVWHKGLCSKLRGKGVGGLGLKAISMTDQLKLSFQVSPP